MLFANERADEAFCSYMLQTEASASTGGSLLHKVFLWLHGDQPKLFVRFYRKVSNGHIHVDFVRSQHRSLQSCKPLSFRGSFFSLEWILHRGRFDQWFTGCHGNLIGVASVPIASKLQTSVIPRLFFSLEWILHRGRFDQWFTGCHGNLIGVASVPARSARENHFLSFPIFFLFSHSWSIIYAGQMTTVLNLFRYKNGFIDSLAVFTVEFEGQVQRTTFATQCRREEEWNVKLWQKWEKNCKHPGRESNLEPSANAASVLPLSIRDRWLFPAGFFSCFWQRFTSDPFPFSFPFGLDFQISFSSGFHLPYF